MKRTKGVSQSRLARLLLLTLLMGLVPLSPAVVFGRKPPPWLPEPVRNWSFDVLLVLSPPAKKVSSILSGSPADDRLYLDRFGEQVSLKKDGSTLVGTLFRPEEAGEFPGIVLVHGSTAEGRKLGLYRLLGHELAGRGYVVLSIDLRGYGDSDDPPRVDDASALDYPSDIVGAVDYLSAVASVDPGRIYVIGHSLGAAPTIAAGIRDDHVLAIIAIGPPRHVEERYLTSDSPEFLYFYRRTMRYTGLSQSIPFDVFQRYLQEKQLSSYTDTFSEPGHKPIFLIDGSLESDEDRRYLQQFYQGLTEPKEYLTLESADHYANVANFGPIIFFDRKTADQLVDAIDLWLDGIGTTGSVDTSS